MTTRHHSLLVVLGLVLAAWGFFLFFQSAYFGSFFYGVPTPWWAQWVGSLPLWAFDAIDTVMVGILVLSIYLASSSSPRHLGRSARGGIGGTAVALLGLFLLIAFLAALGFNLAGLWTDFKSFFAGLSVLV